MRQRLTEYLAAKLQPLAATLDKVAATTNLSDNPNEPDVNARLRILMGQDFPQGNGPWRMSIRNSALRIDALEQVDQDNGVLFNAMQLQLSALSDAIALQLGPGLAMLAAEIQQTKATQQAEQTKLTANTLADQARAAWLALVDAEGKETKAQLALTKAESAANKLALAATDAKNTAQQLQIDANTLATQAADAKAGAAQSTGTAALAAAATAQAKADAAQTKADTAQAKAEAAQTKADAAQAKADTATTKADAATAKADTAQATATTAATNAVTAITNAAAAQTTATAAQVAMDAFKARFRSGTVATPAVTVQVATPATVLVTFTPAYTDTNYVVTFSKTATGLLPVDLSATNKTVNSFLLNLRNTGIASVAIPAGAVDYEILHA